MSESRSVYEEKLEAQLKEWSAQIGLLKAKANNAKADARIDLHKTVDALQKKQEEARAKLHELTSAGDEAWGDLKAGAEKAWSDVRKSLHDAMSRFT